MKSLYRHKQSGDLFAIETDPQGNVLSSSGPLLSRDLAPKALDYDDYWNIEIQAKLPNFKELPKPTTLNFYRETASSFSLIKNICFD